MGGPKLVFISADGGTIHSEDNTVTMRSNFPETTMMGFELRNNVDLKTQRDNITMAVGDRAERPRSAQGSSGGTPEDCKILSLDGGVIHDLSALIILKSVMLRLNHKLGLSDEPLRPCDHFDLICGCGNGGLVALMLGSLGMTVDECIVAYDRLSKDLSKERAPSLRLWQDDATLHHANVLNENVKRIVREKTGDADTKMKDTPSNTCCKTFVVAIASAAADAPPVKFRTYTTEKAVADGCTIWQAARATMADGTFFSPIAFGSPIRVAYCTGALGYNNPAMLAISECKDIWPDLNVGCLLSIGAGRPDVVSVAGNTADASSMLIASSERVDEEVRRGGEQSDNYFRFSVDRGLGTFKSDEEIAGVTDGYLRFFAQDKLVGKCVEKLANAGKRSRMSDRL